jgi:RimJ/RimL family protein N-acetyltransferase
VPTNEHGQAVGPALPGWRPCPFPDLAVLRGHWATVEAMRPEHAGELYAEVCGAEDDPLWTYSSVGPFAGPDAFADFVEERASDSASVAVTLRDGEGRACGMANLLAIQREHGTVEIGGIVLGRRLQRTTAATEATYLLARHVFGLGYRRLEWKCDALNEPSRRAAARLGFTYEGRFRNAITVKGRSRDTDWFSITDGEWPTVARTLEAWLDPANHDDGRQRRRLQDLRRGS